MRHSRLPLTTATSLPPVDPPSFLKTEEETKCPQFKTHRMRPKQYLPPVLFLAACIFLAGTIGVVTYLSVTTNTNDTTVANVTTNMTNDQPVSTDTTVDQTSCTPSNACGSSVRDDCVIVQKDCPAPSRRRTAFADVALSIETQIDTMSNASPDYKTLQSNLATFQSSPTTAYWFAYGPGFIAWNNIQWTPNRCPHELLGDPGSGGLSKDVLKSNCSIHAFSLLACECVFYEVEVAGKVTSLKNSYGNSLMPLLLEKVNNYSDFWERPGELKCGEEFQARQREIEVYYEHFASNFTRTKMESLKTTDGTYKYDSSNEFARVLCNGMEYDTDNSNRPIYLLDYVVRGGQLFRTKIRERIQTDVAPGCSGIDWGFPVSPSRLQIVYIGLMIQMVAKFMLGEPITNVELSYKATPIAELRTDSNVACRQLPDDIDVGATLTLNDPPPSPLTPPPPSPLTPPPPSPPTPPPPPSPPPPSPSPPPPPPSPPPTPLESSLHALRSKYETNGEHARLMQFTQGIVVYRGGQMIAEMYRNMSESERELLRGLVTKSATAVFEHGAGVDPQLLVDRLYEQKQSVNASSSVVSMSLAKSVTGLLIGLLEADAQLTISHRASMYIREWQNRASR